MTFEKATFGAGCFWGVEARFAALPGVLDTSVGYAGGETEQPTYEQVCAGGTGHAEVVEVTYNPAKVTYPELLNAFFAMHNPSQPYRRTSDPRGPSREQYRSVIFTHTEEQAREAQACIAAMVAPGKYASDIATVVLPIPAFWRAEDRHQQYYAKRNIQP